MEAFYLIGLHRQQLFVIYFRSSYKYLIDKISNGYNSEALRNKNLQIQLINHLILPYLVR